MRGILKEHILLYCFIIGLFTLQGCKYKNYVVDSNDTSIKNYLKLKDGIECESTWVPNNEDIANFHNCLKSYIEKEKNSSKEYQYVLSGLKEYKYEFAGYIKENKKFIFCYMSVFGDIPANQFYGSVKDGGCGVVRVVFDFENNKVLNLRCNFNP